VVEVTYSDIRASSSGIEGAGTSSTEILHVDLSRILDFVSPDELERYENEQFRIEAEAEAIAMRVEAEALARRRLERNKRMVAIAQRGLGPDQEARTRGRPRGRGRGRGRGSWRGRSALVTNSQPHNEDKQEELVGVEPEATLRRVEEDLQLMIAETESDEDDFETPRGPLSPSIARSAFVANSALPVSPVLSRRRPSIIASTQYDDYESAMDPVNADERSISSAAMQLRIKEAVRGRTNESSEDGSSHSGHRSKRRRTESTPPNHRTSPVVLLGEQGRTEDDSEAEKNGEIEDGADTSDNGDDAEEHVVEAIIDHYRDDVGKKWYLVKWQGYEDSHDWLTDKDLEGAAELVAEYNAKVRRKKKRNTQS
jgi:hypothetical protein